MECGMRTLIWTDYETATLQEVVDVLDVINPRGHTVERIKAEVQRSFNDGLDSYIGTAGWYVTVYETPTPGIWHAKPTLMAYSVKKYLEERHEQRTA
jgi:hypothetical protein